MRIILRAEIKNDKDSLSSRLIPALTIANIVLSKGAIVMAKTPHLNLPYISAAQAQKHVTHNEALRALDAIVHLSVLDRDLSTPPISPNEGDRYLVASNAIEEWSGQEQSIAAFQDGAWVFYTPNTGWLAWIVDEAILVGWDGSNWVVSSGGSGSGGGASVNLNPATGGVVGVNATADATNRLSVNSPATLFNHEGDDHKIKVNKNTNSDTASVLFQTGFSGRAEFGLTGDDNFHMKVSPDGSNWTEGMVIDGSTAQIGIGSNTPDASLHIKAADSKVLYIGPNDTFVNENHQMEIIGVGNRTPLMIAGGSGLIEFWKETEIASLTAAVSFGMAMPGQPVGDDFVVSGYSNTLGWQELIRIKNNSEKTVVMQGPVSLGSYSTASLPSASNSGAGAMIFVSDAVGGSIPAFSDGVNWLRCTDRSVI